MKQDAPYLRDILDSIRIIERHTRGRTFEQFQRSVLRQDAVVRRIAIIGEAARHVSTATQQLNPAVPWSDIVGMRNILVHDYLGTDFRDVWKTVQEDIPVLKTQIIEMLDSLKEP
jgi:uncharacterized protein with HEPN domain